MTDTTWGFTLLATVATVALFTAIMQSKSAAAASTVAWVIFAVGIGLGIVALALSVVDASGLARLTGVSGIVFRVAVYRGWVVIGGAVVTATLLMLGHTSSKGWRHKVAGEPIQSFVTSPRVAAGIAYSAALAYIAIEIGKLAHDGEMRRFFAQSGLPIWANYAVMAAEVAGAVGLVLPKTRVVAAIGLSIILVGAIGTHCHNGDPFSDSLEAVNLLVTLLSLVVILLLRDSETSGFR